MSRRKARLVKLLGGFVLFFALMAGSLWFLLTDLVWDIQPQPRTRGMALADLDGDGDLDAFLANGRGETGEPNTVLLNEGNGRFHDSGQRLGQGESKAVVLHDFDGDGDVDALVSSHWPEYFQNDGNGTFTHAEFVEMPPLMGILRFAAAELNGDDQVDLFVAACCGARISNRYGGQPVNSFNTIWLGEGERLLEPGSQRLGQGSTEAAALGDLDGDGDLDAFGANNVYFKGTGESVVDANDVWFNDGQGVFRDSKQRLGDQRSFAVALGDLDDDGDLDALVGNDGPDEVWWNDGQGKFTNSGQTLSSSLTRFLYLADLDEDGDLDAFSGDELRGRIWLNDGQGTFQESGQQFWHFTSAVALGDVDGNDTVDVVAGKVDEARIWLNDGTGVLQPQ